MVQSVTNMTAKFNHTSIAALSVQLPLLLLLLLLISNGVSEARPMSASQLECDVCKGFVALARRLIDDGQSSVVPEAAKVICKYKYKEASQVCDGVVKLWMPMAKFAADKIYIEPHRVCGQLLGSSCSNTSIPQLNEMWNISLPSKQKPPIQPPRPPRPGAPTLRILHISDVHIDLFYSLNASADCGLPTCCRISDAKPDNNSRKAGYWGDYNCDQPVWVLERILKQLADQRSHQPFDVIYFTGDLPDHHVWKQTQQQQLQAYAKFANLMRKYFADAKFVSAMGNHESLPVNSFPPSYIGDGHQMQWLYEQMWQSLQHWLPADQKQNVLRGGYYTQLLRPGFRVVSLNVNYANNLNWWILQNITDPDNQLQWLIQVLQSAEDKGEKVHILGHIPPNQLLRGYSWNYFKIAKRFESTITGHFYGHTHMDSFGVFFDPDDSNRAFGTVYVMGSLKAQSNPSYRIYEVDADPKNATWQVLDYENYIFNLTAANSRGEGQDPEWLLEYKPTTAYQMKQTFPSDWADLINRFVQDDALFQKFYRYYNKIGNSPSSPCTGDCKKNFICKFRNQRAGDRSIPC